MRALTPDDYADLREAEYQHAEAWPTLCVNPRSGVMRQQHDWDREGTCYFCDRKEDERW